STLKGPVEMGRFHAENGDGALSGCLDDTTTINAGDFLVSNAGNAHCAQRCSPAVAQLFESEFNGYDTGLHVKNSRTTHAVAVNLKGLALEFADRPHRVVVGDQQHVTFALRNGPLRDQVVTGCSRRDG